MNEATVDALLEQIAALEQKLANRELLLQRILIWLRGTDRGRQQFLTEIEKHLAILQEVEGDRQVHLEDGVELEDKR